MSMFRKAGGVVGTISNTQWKISEFESKKGATYSKLSFNFDFQIEGADVPQQRFVDAGFLMDGTTVSEDGKTLVNDEVDGGVIHEDTEFARWVGSLIASGYPEGQLDPTGRNYEAIEGTRVQLTFWTDKAKTEKLGQRIAKKGKYAGKGFDYQEMRVAKVYGAEEGAPTAATKTTAGRKAAPKAAAAQDTSAADTVILDILADAPKNAIEYKGLNAAVVKYAIKNKLSSADRDTLRAQVTDEAYLVDASTRGVISYKGKNAPVTLSAVAA